MTIEIASDSSTVIEPIPAITASLQHNTQTSDILIGYGDKHFCIFEQLSLNFKEKMQVLVRTDPKKLFASKKGNKKSTTVTSNTDALKTLVPTIISENVEYKTAITVSAKKMKTTDIPMETRLQNLNLNVPAGSVKTQAQSKVQLLVQALHSKDAKFVFLLDIFCVCF